MRKIIFLFLIFIFILSILFFIVYSNNNKLNIVDNSLSENNIIKDIKNNSPKIKDYNDSYLTQRDQKSNKDIEDNKIKKEFVFNIDTVVDLFKSQKFIINNLVDDFVQISDKEIVHGDIQKDQCILNIFNKNIDLSLCDFAKNECADLGCTKFDCEIYKNNWFKVVYYGDFVGSGDKELVYKNKSNILIANLECGDKSLENYDNKLFRYLVSN